LQKLFRLILVVCLIPTTLNLFAEESQPVDDQTEVENVKQQIEKNIPNITIDSVTKSRMPGIYEVLTSGQILYVSEDAKYLISGKLFSIENGIKDLTEESMQRVDMKMAPMRRDKVSAVRSEDMIIFKAPEEKHRITVFTDVDCAYCRKLHKEMDNYNKLGITVQYMGFPRAGLGSPSHKKLQTVWCAKDPVAAMNKAKLERAFGTDTCEDPLASHMNLVRQFGLNGTPAIILKSGRYLPGYLEADQLLAILEQDNEQVANTVSGTE